MSMDLRAAWTTLGFDPEEVVSSLKSARGLDRAKAAQELEARAAAVCKKLLAAHHPDRNPDDAGAPGRFRRVKNAMEIISAATAELVRETREDPGPSGGKVSIVFGSGTGAD